MTGEAGPFLPGRSSRPPAGTQRRGWKRATLDTDGAEPYRKGRSRQAPWHSCQAPPQPHLSVPTFVPYGIPPGSRPRGLSRGGPMD